MVAKFQGKYENEYKKLNKFQKEAVETLDGPIMVVAGPGTGKTQVLSLRIANILKKTDIKADGILCLTFTNSAVNAMKERLALYIGEDAEKVNVFTFHSFGMKIIGEYYKVLGLSQTPKLLEDSDTALLFDEILNANDWESLRPRGDKTRYFADLKSLISILKRERISAKRFLSEVEEEMESLEKNPDNISTRGESKGQLKKEILKNVESMARSCEAARFFNLYEKAKQEKNVFDYDDVLENLVKIIETSDNVASEIRERYLYILVDEHQDSSRVQNEFLYTLWGRVENPDLFVVGDDRQLIYGFSGASIDHFKGFKKIFKNAKIITFIDNYRSTQVILEASHALLQSVMSDEKLQSQNKEHHPIRLIEAQNSDEEILACAFDIKDKVRHGLNPNDCAILVPKNKQVRNALHLLHREGLPVGTLEALGLFDQEEMHEIMRVLKIIGDPNDKSALPFSFFDTISDIPPLLAHQYLTEHNMREFSLTKIISEEPQTLWGADSPIEKWIKKLAKWQKDAQNNNLSSVLRIISAELSNSEEAGKLVSHGEIFDTILFLAEKEIEKNSDTTLFQFIATLERLESYSEPIPLIINPKEGIKVLTLHSSKGLEFDYVWIAHMNERSLNSGKRTAFAFPSTIREIVEERDIDAVKRKLYVAITRAKRFCTLSYATYGGGDSEQQIARVVADLPAEVIEKQNIKKFSKKSMEEKSVDLPELLKLVSQKYGEGNVSASLLNDFYECPWRWYFHDLLKLPGPRAESLEFGTAVHSLIDRILKIKSIPSTTEIQRIAMQEISKIEYGNELDKRRMLREIEKVTSRWVKNRLPEISRSRKTEESISMQDRNFPHLKVYGKIDLIENLGTNEVRVTDFKTGSARKKSEIEKLDEESRMGSSLRQLTMYSYLLENNTKWHGVNVRESRLEFLEAKDGDESIYNRVITKNDINLLVRDIEDYDKLLKSGDWVSRPCHYNSYGKNTECEYCKRAEIYKNL